MTTTARTYLTRVATLLVAALFAATLSGCATKQAQSQEQPQGWSRAELEQLLAPVALYPDALLAQLLIAATYPGEIVEAAAWSRRHPTLAGEDAVRAADDIDWDPSVKSLLAFPGLLARMDERIEWTQALGEAFLAEEESVIETVQALRRRARVEGSLASDGHVRVVEEGPRIHVVFASPAIAYLPYYDPRVVYGRWWWPTHPPVVWAPWPGYRHVARGPGVGLWWDPGVRLSVGFFFGGFDWPRRQVRVVRVDTWYVHSAIVRRAPHRTSVIAPGRWRHERTRHHGGPRVARQAPHATPRSAPQREARRQATPRHTPRSSEPRRPRARAVARERTRPGLRKVDTARTVSRTAPLPAPQRETRRSEGQPRKAAAVQRERTRSPRPDARMRPRRTTEGAPRREAKRPEPKREARRPKSKPEAQQPERGPDADTPSRQPGARAAQRRGPRSAPERRPLDADAAGNRRPPG